MRLNKGFFAILVCCSVLLVACEKDKDIPNESEVITTLIYTLYPDGGGEPVTMTFRDLDGDGGVSPEITIDGVITTATNLYTGEMTLLNEAESSMVDYTSIVEEEGDEHQFFYLLSGTQDRITYADFDKNGNPIGLVTRFEPRESGNVQLRIVLRHQPDKYAAGVSEGDILNAGGETDIDVTFSFSIQ